MASVLDRHARRARTTNKAHGDHDVDVERAAVEVLYMGCGNSALPIDMALAGYQRLWCVDRDGTFQAVKVSAPKI